MRVFIGDAEVARVSGPWTDAMLPQLAYTQSADTLLLCRPEMAPQRVTRAGHASWTVQPWAFVNEPFHRFLPSAVLTPSGTSGAITLTASEPLFRIGQAATPFRIGGKRVLVTSVQSPTRAGATVLEAPLASAGPTLDWDESAFSWARGWPVCLCFHQDRLVVGGSRDLPNRLWMSRTGDLFNFDLAACRIHLARRVVRSPAMGTFAPFSRDQSFLLRPAGGGGPGGGGRGPPGLRGQEGRLRRQAGPARPPAEAARGRAPARAPEGRQSNLTDPDSALMRRSDAH